LASFGQPEARRARLMTEVTIPLLFAAIGLPLIGRLYLALFEAAVGALALLNAFIIVLEAAPSLILGYALLGVSGLLHEYEQGRFLSLTASSRLKRVGQWALAALLLQFVVVPVLAAALRRQAWFEALQFDVFNLGVLVFAAFMLTVGAVLEAAAKALQAENEQIV
jgi:hypothetical protein